MNIKALITLLVLGSSSVAMAHPVSYSGFEGAPVVTRDHRMPAPTPMPATAYDGTHHSPVFVPQWTTLGTASQISNGAMKFYVSPSAGKFTMLRLQTAAGKAFIKQVEIKFAGGATQVVALNQYLNAANPIITIDLDGNRGRSIRNVTVVAKNTRQSSFRVQAI